MKPFIFKPKLFFYGLLIIVPVLVDAAPIRAMGSAAQCAAFGGLSDPPAALAVFEAAVGAWIPSETEARPTAVIVRAAVRELAVRSEWNQKTKAQFWRDIVGMIQFETDTSFISFEVQGSDGSILFHGGFEGTALVIGTKGEIYRGSYNRDYDRRRHVWRANYDELQLLNPPSTATP